MIICLESYFVIVEQNGGAPHEDFRDFADFSIADLGSVLATYTFSMEAHLCFIPIFWTLRAGKSNPNTSPI